jgi:hypothetical protein
VTRGPPILEPVPNAKLLANIVNVARTFRGADENFIIFLSTRGEPALQANANNLSRDLLTRIIAKARENARWTDDEVLRAHRLESISSGAAGA